MRLSHTETVTRRRPKTNRSPGRALTPFIATTLAVLAVGCGESEQRAGEPSVGDFDATRAYADLESQVAFGPRPAGSSAAIETADFLARRLRQAGVEDVAIQRPHRNVVGVIPGTQPATIVLGAHYDTVDGIPDFVGANDGASGTAVLLEIARVLGADDAGVEGPSINFALFDAEEARPGRTFERDGTRGSRQYIRKTETSEIESMILLDMVGDCDLQIPRESGSDRALYSAIAGSAMERGFPDVFNGSTGPISDDHVPFLEAGIPAVDLIDFNYGPGSSPGAYWHTSQDTLEHVCPQSLAAVGISVLGVLPTLLEE